MSWRVDADGVSAETFNQSGAITHPAEMALVMVEGRGVSTRSKAESQGKQDSLPRPCPGSTGWQVLSRIRGMLFISFLYS